MDVREVAGVIRCLPFKNPPLDTRWSAVTAHDPAALLPAAKLERKNRSADLCPLTGQKQTDRRSTDQQFFFLDVCN